MVDKDIKQGAQHTASSVLSGLFGMADVTKAWLTNRTFRRHHALETEHKAEPKACIVSKIEPFDSEQIQQSLRKMPTTPKAPTPKQSSKATAPVALKSPIREVWSKSKKPDSKAKVDVEVQNPAFMGSHKKSTVNIKDYGTHLVTSDETNQHVTLQQRALTPNGVDFGQFYGRHSSNSARAIEDLSKAVEETLRGDNIHISGSNPVLVEKTQEKIAASRSSRLQRWNVSTQTIPASVPAENAPANVIFHNVQN